MPRSLAIALGLTAVLLARPSAAQSAGSTDAESQVRAQFARLGIPFPEPSPDPVRPLVQDLEDPEVRIARQIAANRTAPSEAPPSDEALAVSGDIRVRGNTTSVRIRAASGVGELRTWQGLDVGATATISATSGTLVFAGDQTAQRFRINSPQTIGRMRVQKSGGRLVLDSLGTATFTFGTLDLTDDVLETRTRLTVTDVLAGTGGIALTGAGTQRLQLPPGERAQSLFLQKPSGTAEVVSADLGGTVSPTVFASTVLNAGTARLVGDVTIGQAGTLDLISGVLTLSRNLDVFGVLGASGGDLATAGFTLRLAPTVTGNTVTRLAALSGNGSALTSNATFERPHLDGAGWRMIAAPFASTFQTLNDDFLTQGATGATYETGQPNVLAWDPTRPPANRFVGVTDFVQPMASGSGYFLYAYATQPGTGTPLLPTVWDVSGREPAGDVVSTLSYSPSDAERRFNLLGNPYAAPVDWHAVQTTGRFTATHAVWDPAANGGLGNYAYYSTAGVATGRAGRYIGPGQGFWAESTIQSPFGLVWDRAWKAPTAVPVTAGRTDEALAQLRLHLEGEGLVATEPVALFLDAADDAEDPFDGTWFAPVSTDHAELFFVRSDGTPLVFEARPPVTAAPFRLAVGATRAGTYTLSWPALDLAPTAPLTLVDLQTGARVDLRAQPSYVFDVHTAAPRPAGVLPEALAAVTAPRYELVVGRAATAGDDAAGVTETTLAAARPNPTSGPTVLRFGLAVEGPVRVAVYDLLGRAVATVVDESRPAGWHEASFDASGLAAGVYVVRLSAGTTLRTARLVVAH
ncbi:MAG TPA: T9SS type A sorting domain-containing protein [Rubricoccaceae bacterium]|jgi:hypothetical protein